jgi:cell division protein FtsB
MVILATSALCVTVSLRTHAQKQIAASQNTRIRQDVETLRRGNAVLQRDIERLRNDPNAIESAARSLNMARANEIVLPTE